MKQEALVCRQIVDLVTEWLEGALDETQREAFEEHLAICPDCVAHVDQVQVTVRVTAQVRGAPVEEELRRRLLDAFRSWRSQ